MRQVDYLRIGQGAAPKYPSPEKHTQADELLTLRQIADQLKVCVKTVRNLIRKNDAPIVRVGRQIRLRASHVKLLVRKDQ